MHRHAAFLTQILGSPALVKGHDGVILFDPMTHTVDRWASLLCPRFNRQS